MKQVITMEEAKEVNGGTGGLGGILGGIIDIVLTIVDAIPSATLGDVAKSLFTLVANVVKGLFGGNK
ncbi:hypothetical protein CS022_06905 [Veronia nyctiphanis]|uniref:Uncharacterized protein n=1 Tax=Veronia nyctiphanis TaxID=1278244 RepID=A0A4Q0YRD6_9GAMM|nr:hypothetical protein [Veronia nyctiphanis]RXJ73740.1 hypothetical protein CS022_06905 [Veronia nyctiphanis]